MTDNDAHGLSEEARGRLNEWASCTTGTVLVSVKDLRAALSALDQRSRIIAELRSDLDLTLSSVTERDAEIERLRAEIASNSAELEEARDESYRQGREDAHRW